MRECGDVTSLAESIDRCGQIEPILLRPIPGDPDFFELVVGERRVQAHERLARGEILSRIMALSDGAAQLFEIDENLERKELSVLERAAHIARRKELYEAEHPQARQGGLPGKWVEGNRSRRTRRSRLSRRTHRDEQGSRRGQSKRMFASVGFPRRSEGRRRAHRSRTRRSSPL